MKLFFLTLLLMVPVFSFAQTFQKTFGSGQGGFNNKWDYATSIKQTTDGGYIVTGYSDGTGLGLDDIYLVRFNSTGDTLWTKVYGGTNKEAGRCVVQTSDGGFAVCGETQSYGVFKNDVFLLKTDVNGNLQWAKTYGGMEEDYGYSLQQTTDGGFIIAGETESFGQGGGYADVYIIKTDDSGTIIWTKTYGGGYDDVAYSIQQTTDGGYIVTGDDGSFQTGILLIKLDNTGDTVWSKSIRGNYGGYSGKSVRQTWDGGYVITGYTTDAGFGSYDIFLLKTDVTGTPVYARAYGSSSLDEARSVFQTGDGGYIFTGYTYAASTYSQFHAFKTDSLGVMMWNKTYRSEYGNEGNDVIQTSDGGYAMVGYIYNDFGNTLASVYQGYDAYIVKTDMFGNSPGCVSSPLTGLISAPQTWSAYNCPAIPGSGATVNSASMSSKYSKTNYDDAKVKLNFTSTDVLCGGSCTGTITANTCDSMGYYCSGTAPYTYQWDNSTGNQSASTATSLCVGNYSITITDNYGCSGAGISSLNIDVLPAEICLVTVDSTSSKNIIVWEKPATMGIDSFLIYREIGLNNYVKIGSVAYSASSEFTDNTNGVNPKIQSYRYKISVLDTCANESVLSSHHRTIHLSTPQFTPPNIFDLIWTNDYEGFSISGYNILRDGNNTGVWDSIGFVTYGNQSYTDLNAPSDSARYIVEAAHPTGCTAQKMLKTYNASKSNTASSEAPIGIGELRIADCQNCELCIYPNPNNGRFTLSTNADDKYQHADQMRQHDESFANKRINELRIMNILGEVVMTKVFYDSFFVDLDLPEVSAGLYFIRLRSGEDVYYGKFLVE